MTRISCFQKPLSCDSLVLGYAIPISVTNGKAILSILVTSIGRFPNLCDLVRFFLKRNGFFVTKFN